MIYTSALIWNIFIYGITLMPLITSEECACREFPNCPHALIIFTCNICGKSITSSFHVNFDHENKWEVGDVFHKECFNNQ